MGELLNLVGLGTGVVLYAMLLAMVVRAGRSPGVASRFDRLLLATAVLGLLWNVCVLPTYELPKVGIEHPFPLITAIGFSALGFLPTVVVHSVLRGGAAWNPVRRLIATIAYTASVIAASLHVRAALTGALVPSAAGLQLLTYTFVALAVPLAVVTRRQPGARRALWIAALAMFAVSALHLSHFHQGGEPSWPVELVGHHASVPLAFAILYQDYPFALADLFLKRALALLAIVVVSFVTVAQFGAHSAAFAQFMRSGPSQVGILVTLSVATALLYPAIRRAATWFVDAVVLARPDYAMLRATIARSVQAHDDIPSLLTDVCAQMAPALSAGAVRWQEWDPSRQDDPLGSVVLAGHPADAAGHAAGPGATAAVILVPTGERPRYAISIGELTRGRRLLSDDLATLDAIAVILARRIDALRITEERYEREVREQEIAKLASEAELRALRAQINPHFLFNALTTIGYLIQTAPPRALQTLMRLTALLRGVLTSEGELTTLGHELDVVEAYLDIERARFDERLRVHIDVPAGLRELCVPPLVLQPLVENAVKHGIAPRRSGGEVSLRAEIDSTDADAPRLRVVVHDTGIGATPEALARGRDAGVGLRNVERRLACQYGRAAALAFRTAPEGGTTVEVTLPVHEAARVAASASEATA